MAPSIRSDIVTIVFAVLEHQRVRITALDNWQPSTLPEPQDGRPVPRGESLFALIANITFLLLLDRPHRLAAVAELGDDPGSFRRPSRYGRSSTSPSW